MKALVLTITLGLFAALQAQEPLSTRPETQDFTGTWYVKAMATDKHMPMEKRPDKVSPVTMTALDGGDLEVSFTFMKADQCHEKRIVLQQMAEPGKFSTCGGKKNVYLLELPVEDHYIFYCKGSFHMGKLMGKKPDLNLEALEEFKKFTQRKGLPQESIFLPLQMENCIPETALSLRSGRKPRSPSSRLPSLASIASSPRPHCHNVHGNSADTSPMPAQKGNRSCSHDVPPARPGHGPPVWHAGHRRHPDHGEPGPNKGGRDLALHGHGGQRHLPPGLCQHPLRMYIQELRPTPEDNLEIVMSQRENHLCVRRSITARRTEDPAVFAVAYEGERKISVLDTDYTDYMFFCMDATEPTAEQGTVCQYLARTLKVDNKVMEKFHRTFQTLPVHMRIILDLTQGRGELWPPRPLLAGAPPQPGEKQRLPERVLWDTGSISPHLRSQFSQEAGGGLQSPWGLPPDPGPGAVVATL
ncbi:Odorant-Binding Protein 2B [Manis pentadactyla]|nr:Odorant-Binding Protein 2B [Manis pentadactyla]